MQIALVSRELHPYTGGGIAAIVAATARTLSEAFDVTVVTSGGSRAEHERLRAAGDPRLLPEAVRIVWVEEPGENVGGAHLSYMHAYSERVYAALRAAYPDRGPEVIEFCDYLGEGFVTVQARRTLARWLERTLVCVRLHTTSELVNVLDGHIEDDLATVATHDAERYVLRHADRILWSGGDVLETYRRFYGADALAPAVRIPDAFLRESDAEEDTGEVAIPGRPLRMLYLGRMERRKGPMSLLRAVTALERDDWRLSLVGGDTTTAPLQGSMLTQLEFAADEDERIEFIPPVSRADVQRHVRHAHLVVVPSLWECWPNVVREALMHNRPVLATPTGGMCEMVQEGRSGWLTRDASAQALAEAIEERLDDPESVTDLVLDRGPRAVFDELTDPVQLVDRYRALAGEPFRRPPRRPGAPLVSIVVPYFRLERHVEETLRSALAQTHPALEVLLVNDGSLRPEDGPVLDLCGRLGVRVVAQVNSGLGAARNFGIAQSRGRYVLPLDADDLIAPEFVARCLEPLERDPDLAYVTTGVEYMHPDGAPMAGGAYMPYGNWSRLIERNNVGGTCVALMRRRLFDRGFRYSEDLTSYEDWLLYLELYDAGHVGAVIPERLIRYRVRQESMMREVGAPQLTRLAGELRAHRRERAMRWTASDVPSPAPVVATR
jgi:glycogen synthase